MARWIEEDPAERYVRRSLVEASEHFSWDLAERDELAQWKILLPDADYRQGERGLVLSTERRFFHMHRTADFAAVKVDALELVVREIPRQPITLEWRGPGQRFSEERRITVDLGRHDGAARVYRFVTIGHPEWRGQMVEIRLGIVVPQSMRPVEILRLNGLSERIPDDRLAAAFSQAWKLELGGELRNAALALPGIPFQEDLEVPADGAELRLGYGVQRRVHQAVTFRAVVKHGEGTAFVGERTVVFEDTLAPGHLGWRDAVIDLAAFSGRRLVVRLEVEADGELDPRLGFAAWAHPEVLVTGERPPNLLLISVDTLRADHLSLYGYPRPTSPSLDAWARARAVTFEQVIAAASWTLPSHTSIFSGLDAHRHGANYNVAAPRSLRMLAEILRDAGYATAAVTGGGFVHPQNGFDQGFQRFRPFSSGMGVDEELEQGVAEVHALLEEYAERPFFLFFHTYEVHNPFRPRQPFLEQLTGRTGNAVVDVELFPNGPEELFVSRRGLRLAGSQGGDPAQEVDLESLAVDLYDSEIAYTDAFLGELFTTLDRLDLSRRTLVILTSDHGELFGEHGAYNHISLHEENLRVPLVLADPFGRWAGERITEPVRSVDLLPTALEALGLPGPQEVDGVSLLPLLEGGGRPIETTHGWSYAAATNHGIALRSRDQLKYVFRNSPWATGTPEESFYALGPDGAATPLDASAEPRFEGLRRATQGALAQTAGLRLVLSNRQGSAALPVTLRGAVVNGERLKSLQPGAALLHPVAGGEPAARLSLPAGRELALNLEGVSVGDLRLEIGRDGEVFTAEIVLQDLGEEVWSVTRDAAGWRVSREPWQGTEGPPEDGIFAWWHRRPIASDPAPTEADAERLRQLEALGYLQ